MNATERSRGRAEGDLQRSRRNRALVTGASTGIGEAFARRLAAGGSALVLVARDEQRLRSLAEELRAAHGVEIEVLAADLIDTAGAALVADRLGQAPPIDLLVNNAGMGSKGRFADLDVEAELRQIGLNVTALVRLTHEALRAMSPRGAGTIINVSSLSGLHPGVTNATYGATKAFVNSFTDALHEEARGSGVTVTLVLPGYVRTEFIQRTGNAAGFSEPPGVHVVHIGPGGRERPGRRPPQARPVRGGVRLPRRRARDGQRAAAPWTWPPARPPGPCCTATRTSASPRDQTAPTRGQSPARAPG